MKNENDPLGLITSDNRFLPDDDSEFGMAFDDDIEDIAEEFIRECFKKRCYD